MYFTTYRETRTGIALIFHLKDGIELTASNNELGLFYKFIFGDGLRIYNDADSWGNTVNWDDEPNFKFSSYTKDDYDRWAKITNEIINKGKTNSCVSITFDSDCDLEINVILEDKSYHTFLLIDKGTDIPNIEYDFHKQEYVYTNTPTNINIDNEIGKKEIVTEINNTYNNVIQLRIENYVLKQRVDTLEKIVEEINTKLNLLTTNNSNVVPS